MTTTCLSCGGAGRVVTGAPLGTCDGPQYGTCPSCGGAGRVTAAEPPAAFAALEAATVGLTYQSETDAPWRVRYWPTGSGVPSVKAFRKSGQWPTGTPIHEESLKKFFDALAATNPEYAPLVAAVRTHLPGAVLVKVGKINVELFVVAEVPSGGWLGLTTTAVET